MRPESNPKSNPWRSRRVTRVRSRSDALARALVYLAEASSKARAMIRTLVARIFEER